MSEGSPPGRAWTLLVERGLLLGAMCLLVYAALAPAHIVDGDGAEFAALGTLGGGVAHPSGYPLYVLWLRLMSWMPGATPAHAMALATCLLAAAQVVVLHAAARAWGARATPAAVAIALYAGAPTVLRMHSQAEVFALNGLMVALVLWIAAPEGPLRGARRTIGLALVAGLGLSNHLTCVLVAPVGIYGAIRGLREAPARRAAIGAAAVGALVVGLLPYAYLLIARGGPFGWQPPQGLVGVVRHALRLDYGGVLQFAAKGEVVTVWENWAAFGETIARSWLWLPLAAGLVTLAWRCRRGAHRAAWVCLTASWLLAGPILVTRFNLSINGGTMYVNSRFYLLPTLLLTIPVAVALGAVGDRLALRARALAVVAPALALILSVAVSLDRLGYAHSPALERALRRELEAMPERAVMIGEGDHYGFGGGYLQHAAGVRPDVVRVYLPFLSSDWYSAKLAEGLGFDCRRDAQGQPLTRPPDVLVRLLDGVLAQGRAVYMQPNLAARRPDYPSYLVGITSRVLARGSSLPTLADVRDQNLAWFEALDLRYPRPRTDGDWDTTIHHQYEYVWRTLGDKWTQVGDARFAEEAYANARDLAPR